MKPPERALAGAAEVVLHEPGDAVLAVAGLAEGLDEVAAIVTVDDRSAYRATMELARKEGIFGGSSSGAAVEGARRVAREAPAEALVVTLIPDSGERYLSKLNAAWMGQKGLL